VCLHDCLGAPERAQRRESQRPRASGTVLFPEALENELEIRRLDATASVPDARNLVEDRVDESRLDLDGFPRELVPAVYRTDDRRARGLSIEMLEAKLVREDLREAGLEDVELRK
jgi:hypothetical protein